MKGLGNCHLEPLSLVRIQDNPLLDVSLTKNDVQRCVQTFKQYGILRPLVLRRTEDGAYSIINGSCELKALRQLRVGKTDAVVIHGISAHQAHKLSLCLLSLHSSPDALSEAYLVTELLQETSMSQSDVALLVGKSISWVSKRVSLAQRLTDSVRAMVADKLLCTRTAQEIAKLPPKLQSEFATRVVSESLPKSSVERLVTTYNKLETSDSLKKQIVIDPKNAIPHCKKILQPKQAERKGDPSLVIEKRLLSCLQVLTDVTKELEQIWATVQITTEVYGRLEQVIATLSHLHMPIHSFAPGQTMKGEHHAN